MNYLEKIKIFIEHWICIIISVLSLSIAILCADLLSNSDLSKFLLELLTTYATIASLLTGLLTNAMSNFLSHSSNEIIYLLKKHSFFQTIVNYSQKATIANGISICLSFVFIFLIKFCKSEFILKWTFVLWTTIAAYGFSSYLRAAYIFNLSAKKTFELSER